MRAGTTVFSAVIIELGTQSLNILPEIYTSGKRGVGKRQGNGGQIQAFLLQYASRDVNCIFSVSLLSRVHLNTSYVCLGILKGFKRLSGNCRGAVRVDKNEKWLGLQPYHSGHANLI